MREKTQNITTGIDERGEYISLDITAERIIEEYGITPGTVVQENEYNTRLIVIGIDKNNLLYFADEDSYVLFTFSCVTDAESLEEELDVLAEHYDMNIVIASLENPESSLFETALRNKQNELYIREAVKGKVLEWQRIEYHSSDPASRIFIKNYSAFFNNRKKRNEASPNREKYIREMLEARNKW